MESELLNAEDVTNQDSARIALRKIMVSRIMGITDVSRAISVSIPTVYRLLAGKNVSFKILMKIWRGIEKLQDNIDF